MSKTDPLNQFGTFGIDELNKLSDAYERYPLTTKTGQKYKIAWNILAMDSDTPTKTITEAFSSDGLGSDAAVVSHVRRSIKKLEAGSLGYKSVDVWNSTPNGEDLNILNSVVSGNTHNPFKVAEECLHMISEVFNGYDHVLNVKVTSDVGGAISTVWFKSNGANKYTMSMDIEFPGNSKVTR